MPIFYNNVYKTPYNATKPGLIGKKSFQTTNRKIYLTMLCNIYGSTATKKDFLGTKRGQNAYFLQ